MDERLLRALRAFEADPSEAGATALLTDGERAGVALVEAIAWLADVARWDALDVATRLAVGRGVARALPRARFVGLEQHSLGQQRHEVAAFDVGADAAPSKFVLIPGGTVRLGWSGDLERLLAGLGLEHPISPSELRACLSPARTISLAPFLLEADAPGRGSEHLSGEAEETAFEQVRDGVAAQGFRLPAPDEWEHACAAGAASFWRWGDEWPPGSPYGRQAFDLHRRPNAFGIAYPADTYATEVTAEDLVLCGGDGGGLVCGGDGRAAWFTLGTAFRAPRGLVEDCDAEFYEGAVVRRALSIPG